MSNTKTRLRRVIGGSAVVTLAGATVLAAAMPATAATAPTVNRIAGTDRYETAAMAAAAAFPNGVGTAIIVNGEPGHFADALSANYLAGQLGAPILLSETDLVPTTTMNELKSLNVKNVYLVGGSGVLTAAVNTQLAAAGVTVTAQLGGVDRYATDQLVAESTVGTPGSINGLKTAIVARGDVAADALSAGSLAYAKKLPVILTTPTALSSTASKIVSDLGIQQALVVGGTAAVSTADISALQAISVNGAAVSVLTPAQGTTRSDTSNLLAQWEVKNAGFTTTRFAVASGGAGHEVDALSGGPYAGVNNEPILVTDSVTIAGKTTVFASMQPNTTQVDVLGGTGAVADAAVTAITTAVTTPTTQLLNVTPTSATSVAQGGNVQYTVTGLDNTKTYTVQLFSCDNVTTSNGTTSFTQTATGSGVAAAGDTGNNAFSVVNGTVASNGQLVTVMPSNGSVTFTVANNDTTGAVQSCVVPVVYLDTNGSGSLDVNATTGVSTETFGVGGTATFTPPAAATGHYGTASVVSVDTANGTLTADTNGATAGGVMVFTYSGSNTYFYMNGVQLTAAQFASFVSGALANGGANGSAVAGDTLDIAYNASGPSTFTFTTDVPAAPTSLAATFQAAVATGTNAHPDQVALSWTAPPNFDVASYNIYRASITNGTVGAYTKIDTSNTTTYNDTNPTAGATYSYEVTAVSNNGDEGPVSNAATVTIPTAVAAPTTPVSVTTFEAPASGATTLVQGDQLQVVFDQAVTLSATPSVTLSDGTNKATLTGGSGGNATFALSNGNKTLTINVTGTVFSTGSALSLNKLEVTDQSGITNAQGGWNLAASGYGTSNTRVFGGGNGALPGAPTITGVTAGAANTATVTVNCTATDTVTVYNVNGASLGSKTCASGAVTITSSAALAATDTVYATQMANANGYVSQSDRFSGSGSTTGTVTGVTANPTTVSVTSGAGKDSTITATVTGGGGTVHFTPTSSDTTVATCGITGSNDVPVSGGTATATLHVTWVGVGSATCAVSASLNGSSQSASVAVTAS